MKYGFREIEPDGWRFYQGLDEQAQKSLRNAVYIFNYRNEWGMVTHIGHKDGVAGVWVHRQTEKQQQIGENGTPSLGEVKSSANSRWDLGKVHYEGEGFIELGKYPGDPDINRNSVSLRRAMRRYEEKHPGLKFLHHGGALEKDAHGETVFGWRLYARTEDQGPSQTF
jgi:hypothetical protein